MTAISGHAVNDFWFRHRRPVAMGILESVFAAVLMLAVSTVGAVDWQTSGEFESTIVADYDYLSDEDYEENETSYSENQVLGVSDNLEGPDWDSVLVDTTVVPFGDVVSSYRSEGSTSLIPSSFLHYEENETLLGWKTEYGYYTFPKTTPHVMRLESVDGRLLIERAFFALSGSHDYCPSASTIVSASADRLQVVCTFEEGNGPIAKMLVTIDFFPDDFPKISAEILEVDPSLDDWRIVWIVAPTGSHIMFGQSSKVGLWKLNGRSVNEFTSGKNRLQLVNIASGGSVTNELVLDWSDAGYGSASVRSCSDLGFEGEWAVTVSFSQGARYIDPTAISWSACDSATAPTCAQKTFWYGGYYWAFYDSGYDGIYYACSCDGVSWYVFSAGTGPVHWTTDNYGPHGFALDHRDGTVALSWIKSSGDAVVFMKGRIEYNNILWQDSVVVAPIVGTLHVPVTVTIGYDDRYWVGAQTTCTSASTHEFRVFSSTDGGATFSSVLSSSSGDVAAAHVLLPFADGSVALIRASSVDYDGKDVYIWYWLADDEHWTPSVSYHLGIGFQPVWSAFSAVICTDAAIRIAFQGDDPSYIYYAELRPDTVVGPTLIAETTTVPCYPSMAVDTVGCPSVFYLTRNTVNEYEIQQVYKLSNDAGWSQAATPFPSATTEHAIRHITTISHPTTSYGVLWTEDTPDPQSIWNVRFGLAPLPFGESPTSVDPWNRDGISPFGTYFSGTGYTVNPGTGGLFLERQLVSVEGRGVNLELSMIHTTPRYFTVSPVEPYMFATFPYCNMGSAWQLDLPWIDDTYVYLGDGGRVQIVWVDDPSGNGDATFENHDGIHFLLKKVAVGDSAYYLFLPSGVTYRLDGITGAPQWMCDSNGFDPDLPATPSVNAVFFGYSNGRLASLSDSLLRLVALSYDSNGNLNRITRPDGTYLSFSYTYGSGADALLRTATEYPAEMTGESRTTSYSYHGVDDLLLLPLVTVVHHPTGAEYLFSYGQGLIGTDLQSFPVTWASISGAAAATESFSYSILDGKIVYCEAKHYNETCAFVGRTKYVFQSSMDSSITIEQDAYGHNLVKTVQWYDDRGQIAQVDTYRGAVEEKTYSEYYDYDNWGNQIYKSDAIGHESLFTYANTDSEEVFQTPGKLDVVSSGRILDESFDDREMDGWVWDSSAGGGVVLDTVGSTPYAPSLTLITFGDTEAWASHEFNPQHWALMVSVMMLLNRDDTNNEILLKQGEDVAIRFAFRDNGQMSAYYSGIWHDFMEYQAYKWYRVTFAINAYVAYGEYDIYIDQSPAHYGATFSVPMAIDSILFQADSVQATEVWIDDVRISTNNSMFFSGLLPDHWVGVYDSNDELIQKVSADDDGVASIYWLTDFSGTCPVGCYTPGTIRVFDVDGTTVEYLCPCRAIWGGDVYQYSPPVRRSAEADFYDDFSDGSITDWTRAGTIANVILDDGLDDPPCVGLREAYAYHYVPQQSGHMVFMVNAKSFSIPLDCPYYGAFNKIAVRMGTDVKIIFGFGLDPQNRECISIYELIGGTWYWIKLMDASFFTWYRFVLDIDLTSGTYDLYVDGKVRIRGLHIQGTGPYSVDNVYFASTSTGSYLYYSKLYFDNVIVNPDDDFRTYRGGYPFYDNAIDWNIHDCMVGSFEFQTDDLEDASQYVPIKNFVEYNDDGLPLEIKKSEDLHFVITERFVYDAYGNLIQTADATDHRTYTEYGYNYAYPVETRTVGQYDYFESNSGWTSFETGGRDFLKGAFEGFTTTGANSTPPTSIMVGYSDIRDASVTDYGYASMYKTIMVNKLTSISVRYSCGIYFDEMATQVASTGLRFMLYDSSNTCYQEFYYLFKARLGKTWATPGTYWNATSKVIGDGPLEVAMNSYTMYPNDDWTIDWSRTQKIRIEVFVQCTEAWFGGGTLYVDDLGIDSVTRNTYNHYTGTLASTTDANGGVTDYTYDYLGRVTKIVYPSLDGTRYDVDYLYDDVNNRVTVLDELNRRTVVWYDALGRTAQVDRYDIIGEVYSSEYYSYNWLNKVKRFTNAAGFSVYQEYDCLGRETITTTSPDATSRRIVYDDIANLRTYTNENTDASLSSYKICQFDDLDRLVKSEDQSWIFDYGLRNEYSYDDVGNLVCVNSTDQYSSRETLLSYDDSNRLIRIDYPDGTSELRGYTDAGKISYRRDQAGYVTAYYYDDVGRLHLEHYYTQDGGPPSGCTTYLYDSAGHVTGTTRAEYTEPGEARLIAVTGQTYDALGRVTSKSETIDGKTYTMNLGYDAAGNVISMTYPDTTLIQYTYDEFNRVKTVSWKSRDVVKTLVSYAYNEDDTINTETTLTSFLTTYGYDCRSRVTSVVNNQAGLSETYSYDPAGNVISRNSETFDYDWLNRLREWSNDDTQYTYDGFGNRIAKSSSSQGTSTYSYDSLDRLESDGTWTYEYDSRGNLIQKSNTGETWTYTWSVQNELLNVQQSGGVGSSYTYDGQRARVKVTEGSSSTYYVYLGHDQYYQKTLTAVVDYVYANGHVVAKLTGDESMPRSRTIHFYFYDGLGNVRRVYSGTTLEFQGSYDPFGMLLSSSGTEGIKFSGEIQDSTGLYYLFSRYYDPSTGRFISADKHPGDLSSPQTLNRYVYCLSNPLRYDDPTGEWSLSKWWDRNWKTIAIVAVCVVVSIVVPGAGTLIGSMVLGAVTGGLESAYEARMSGAGVGETILKGLLGAGIGAVGGALGFGAGAASLKIMGKYASKYAPSIATKVGGSVQSLDMAVRNKLVSGYAKATDVAEKIGRKIESKWMSNDLPKWLGAKALRTLTSGDFGMRSPYYTRDFAEAVSSEVIGTTYEEGAWYVVDKLWV